MIRLPNLRHAQKKIDAFNAACPIGTLVTVMRDDGTEMDSKTRSEAQLLGGHTPVVWVENLSGCYLLDRVKPKVTMKPTTLEEARKDLDNIRLALKALREIVTNANILANIVGLDGEIYSTMARKVTLHISSGESLEKHILDLYPELK
jgi:hypothetical protein